MQPSTSDAEVAGQVEVLACAFSQFSLYLNCASKLTLKTRLCSESANLRQGVELQPKVIRDSDPDVCQIAPKMSWI